MTILTTYGETPVYRYWERMQMPESHECYECATPIVSTDKVLVLDLGLDDEETMIVCAKCAHLYR